ncbi:MAG: YdcF family protein [Rubrivivax sp.]|nr:YdcF family protein [Rubrivivax sp.]
MNEALHSLGLEALKPLLSALVMPPVPFLLMMLVGARLMFNRRLLAWLLVLVAVTSQYLLATPAVSGWLARTLLHPPAALTDTQIAELKRSPRTTIVVLGGGRRTLAPEYGMATLSWLSVERLRYGMWLSRETGLPVGFSGGIGHGAQPGAAEAEVAARIAEREFGRPLKWIETESRDTRENATKTVALLRSLGYERIVLVTHDFHMRRAARNFERAGGSNPLEIVVAPMDIPPPGRLRTSDWLPGYGGYLETNFVLHEWLGWMAGA